MPSELERKLPDKSLRDFIQQAESSPLSVLVELEVAAPQLGGSRSSAGVFRPAFIADPTPQDLAEQEARIAVTAEQLQKLTGSEPRYLSAAKAFVVRVTPAALQALLELPGIRSIRENRTLKR